MKHYISMYIDNELSIEEKMTFIDQIHKNDEYFEQASELLVQEQELRSVFHFEQSQSALNSIRRKKILGRIRWATAAIVTVVLAIHFGMGFQMQKMGAEPEALVHSVDTLHRFVIYHTSGEQVEIAGSFTRWRRVPLSPAGEKGYWEVTLPLPPGEHRYSFIVDGKVSFPDPTVVARETDDFGSVNSIVQVSGTDGTS